MRAAGWMSSASYRSYGAASTGSGYNMFATCPELGGGMFDADQRMYNPLMGKFFSPDPGGVKTTKQGKPVSWNRYLYANGDPINFFDPTGGIEVAPDYCDDYPDDPICTGLTGYEIGGDLEGESDSGSSGENADDNDTGEDAPAQSCRFANVQEFVQDNFYYAQTLAGTLSIGGGAADNGVGDADILTLSGFESGWGKSKGAAQGAWFGMQGLKNSHYPGQIGCAPITTSSSPTGFSETVCELQFSSFLAAGQAFVQTYGNSAKGVSDPTRFFTNVWNTHAFAVGTPLANYLYGKSGNPSPTSHDGTVGFQPLVQACEQILGFIKQ